MGGWGLRGPWAFIRHTRGGYNSDDITRVGVGGGGGVEPGGSADTDDSELQKPFWQNVSRNNCTLRTVFMGYIKHC